MNPGNLDPAGTDEALGASLRRHLRASEAALTPMQCEQLAAARRRAVHSRPTRAWSVPAWSSACGAAVLMVALLLHRFAAPSPPHAGAVPDGTLLFEQIVRDDVLLDADMYEDLDVLQAWNSAEEADSA